MLAAVMMPHSILLCVLAAAACGSSQQSAADSGLPDAVAGAASDARLADDAGAATPPLRLMTFNIRHGAESSLDQVAAAIRAEDPDVVALQEVDRDTARSGNVDQPYRLGQLTGMASSFRQAYPFDGGSYGLAVLSRLPIVSSDKVVLTSANPDQPRILVVWQLQLASGESLEFANAHLGLDAAERATQADEVLDTLSGRQHVVLLGDLNEAPDGGPQEGTLYSTLTATLDDAWTQAGEGDGFTFPADGPTTRIDYVMLGSDWQPATVAYVSKTETSDHRPVVVDVPMP